MIAVELVTLRLVGDAIKELKLIMLSFLFLQKSVFR